MDRGILGIESIRINFLIVGHTHTTIDQYFSTLTYAIRECAFIGSPLSLRNKFQSCENPLVNRLIRVHYDYKKWFSSVVNTDLVHFQLPHVFWIRRVHGIAICQHKPFSTSEHFLPLEPEGVGSNVEIITKALEVKGLKFKWGQLQYLGIGPRENLPNLLAGNAEKLKEAITLENPSLMSEVHHLAAIVEHLEDIELNAIVELERQMDDEENFGQFRQHTDATFPSKPLPQSTPPTEADREIDSDREPESNETHVNAKVAKVWRVSPPNEKEMIELKSAIQDYLKDKSTSTRGYCTWLEYTKLRYLSPKPDVFDYFLDANIKVELAEIDDPQLKRDNKKATAEDNLIQKTKLSAKRVKQSVMAKVKSVTDAAKVVLEKIKSGFYEVLGPTITEFSYRSKALTEAEYQFYQTNSTAKGVLESLHEVIEEETKEDYSLIPYNELTQETIQGWFLV